MERTTTRNKARDIESTILNKIAERGAAHVAAAIGIDKSQITRWKEALIPRMAMLLAVLEWGVEDEDLARLAKQVARMLTKEKSPAATEDSTQQFSINF